jgi:hypothetical protein
MERELLEGRSWSRGLSLIVLTIAIHTAGAVIAAFAGGRVRISVEHRRLTPPLAILVVTIVVGATLLILAVLHGLEALVWAAAAAYMWLGAVDSILDALLYSIGTVAARGTRPRQSRHGPSMNGRSRTRKAAVHPRDHRHRQRRGSRGCATSGLLQAAAS